MNELVTIIMSAYNHGEYVEDAIKSVLNQTYKNYKFIVADDASTDNTVDVLMKYEDVIDEIHLYDTNSGYGRGSELILLSQTKYTAIINSDDRWEPQKLEKQITYMEQHPEYGACFTWCDEVDEDGNPYYIASVYKYTIGLFGGETVEGAISCDPISGDCQYYDASEVPNWMDDVFDGDLLVEQYNWYGELSNGFMNSIFGKKGCKKCTETVVEDEDGDEESYEANFGYVAKDGDIWIYTGVTSVNDDASNIGFILVNERTSEAHYYSIAGADESSAMAAAEGEVQEKGYRASFPSLINVDGQPTYIMVLKDASGIVKLYGMVNVESYNMVTTAASLDECFAKYRKMTGSGSAENAEDMENAENPSNDNNNTTGNATLHTKRISNSHCKFTNFYIVRVSKFGL